MKVAHIGAILIALTMTATGLAVANILPVGPVDSSYLPGTLAGSPADIGIGPDNGNACETTQAFGAGGNAQGSGPISGGNAQGTNGYHRYGNDQTIGLLDACISGGVSGEEAFVNCAVTAETTTESDAVAQVPNGPLAVANVVLLDEGNLIGGSTCGGIAGTGSDGEFEYGTNTATLNVDVGGPTATHGNQQANGYCIGNPAAPSAHHAGDTAVGVWDAVLGGDVGFSVGADYARGAATSSDGVNHNTAGTSAHCGDFVLEPCATGHRGFEDDILFGVNTVDPVGAATQVAADAVTAAGDVAALDLHSAGDVAFGCNPLDTATHFGASSPLPDPTTGGNYQTLPGGCTLLSCYDGIGGWALVIVDATGPHVSLTPPGATPEASTFGWIWSGN